MARRVHAAALAHEPPELLCSLRLRRDDFDAPRRAFTKLSSLARCKRQPKKLPLQAGRRVDAYAKGVALLVGRAGVGAGCMGR